MFSFHGPCHGYGHWHCIAICIVIVTVINQGSSLKALMIDCVLTIANVGITIGPGFPTVLAEPVARPDEFYTDQHVKGVIRLSSRW